MVRHGDFEIQLVEAATKNPFKEYHHNEQVFVEVEPGQEYFIAVKKVNSDIITSAVRLEFFVDGQKLGYATTFSARKTTDSFDYKGMWNYKNGISTHSSLKFVIPKSLPQHKSSKDAATTGLGMVEVKVFQALNPFKIKRSAFESPKIDEKTLAAGSQKSKPVRSLAGNHEEQAYYEKTATYYDKGRLLDTVTLYYCATPGLIQVGVLPSPPSSSLASSMAGHSTKKRSGSNAKFEEKRQRGTDAEECPFDAAAAAAAASMDNKEDEEVEIIKSEPKMYETVDLTMTDDDSDKEEDSKIPATTSS